ncbi:MAG: glycerol-3-phosphate 1-O-acyltransferase PlsY [Coriobacteriales bacterium]
MTLPIALVLSYVLAFLLGSIPSGVVIGRLFFGVDPRSGGSGSIGATNSNRMLGAKGGVAVLLADMLKGAVAVGIARLLIHLGGFAGWEADALLMGSVFFGVAGHIYSPWLGFKGGKGISTGFGTLLVASPGIALGILVVFIVFAVASRIVSVGSIAAACSVTVWAFLFHWGSVPAIAFAAAISAVVVFAHRANIKRLIAHEEPTFSLGKSPKDKAAEQGGGQA